jgi:hypothetical protein
MGAMNRKHIPPCTECRRNTPPLGETVCRSCQSVNDAMDQRHEAQSNFYSNIDDVEDPATKACLEALFHLTRGEET